MAQITTLLPTFQRAHLLEEAIESVRKQTYTDWVLYIFDNASLDGTEEIVSRLQEKDKRIYYIKREKNVGLFNNFTLSLESARTPFFHLFSDDDLLYPWFYEKALQGFECHPKAALSGCKTLVQNERRELNPYQFSKKNKMAEGFFPNPEGVAALMKAPFLWTGALFRREVLQKVPRFNADVGLIFDLEFSLRVASHFPITISSTPVALFSQWEHSNSSKLSTPQPNFLAFTESILKEIKPNTSIKNEINDILTNFKNLCLRNYWILLYLAKEDQKIREALPYLHEQKYSEESFLRFIFLLQDKIPGSAFVFRLSIKLIKVVRKLFRMPYCFNQRRRTLSFIKLLSKLQPS